MGIRKEYVSGTKYDKLTLLKEVDGRPTSNGRVVRRANFQCSCGNSITVDINKVTTGIRKTCGKCVTYTRDRKLLPLVAEEFLAKIHKDLGLVDGTRRVELVCNECGNIYTRPVADAKRAKTGLCDTCIRKSGVLQGASTHPLYATWYKEVDRCINSKSNAYASYGGRGITIADEFLQFSTWLEYVGTLEQVATGELTTLDRIDNDKGYERGNLRWATITVQNTNQRVRTDNLSGFKGVSSKNSRWQASIAHKKVNYYIGMYDTKEEAAIAYNAYVTSNKWPHKLNEISKG